METRYSVRKANLSDLHKIKALYRTVAALSGGIAREADEVTWDYVRNFIEKSLGAGVILAVENPLDPEEIIAEVHTYTPGIKVFAHVFGDLTIVVHPDHQEKGVGKLLFATLMEEIESRHPEIVRVELIARESNEKAIRFYKKFGFKAEGRLENRICGKTGKLEADIPMGWVRQGPGQGPG
ncbi:GNAT family N-acetyltransferase [Methanosarcina sp. KYL-1]|uniref:GNAT family N-acetyltransferase n=1 Tax=Methanosarcina sp. KYL-1 TaxID=2602068 RepID=UPI002100B939|nr:GNAT family N-acetyltransferase [Methanosarcina sp. KYL-1]